MEQMRVPQESLCWNAPSQRTGAAETDIAVNDDGFHTELARAHRGDIPPGPGSDDGNVKRVSLFQGLSWVQKISNCSSWSSGSDLTMMSFRVHASVSTRDTSPPPLSTLATCGWARTVISFAARMWAIFLISCRIS